ncbi:siderophore ferric iron reductase [Psychromonas sp. B3M02]|uniref:siderophore ferric iron reductase n=1 Tax=Psychromonas sp. B3M02 TaxID=2267226 RepID=UPI000DEA8FE7|nr:siderophore ferric iron reductase [Psychromonas sp. B3M02]RBW47634.1 siderophore ferric iron reductase [Psychromonas sp. B3M02]
MSNRTLQTDSLTSMLNLCRQVIPYLDGKFETLDSTFLTTVEDDQWLQGNHYDQATIIALRNDLKRLFPDAGEAYYQARVWHLLCWQPIYIAFISIYGLQRLPDFSQFKQQRQHNAIIGFTFQSEQMVSGTPQQLIAQTKLHLAPLIEHYRVQLDNVERCRPGYADRFVADLIFGNLLKVKALVSDFSGQDILSHATLWVEAMGLPQKLLETLTSNPDNSIEFVRSSCCLADKIDEELCANCPKIHKNKQ